tara:strand:+ start:390 stop:794 length:405 start_codon:yes stop_codon:yes gene_type:complete
MTIRKVLDYKNLLAGFMIILVCSMTGCNYITYSELGEVSEADCDAVGEFVIGKKYKYTPSAATESVNPAHSKNLHGLETKIVDAYNMTEVSRKERMLICKGEAKTTGFGKSYHSIQVIYGENGKGEKYHDIELD